MDFKEKLKKYILTGHSVVRHGHVDTNRDYEVVFHVLEDNVTTELLFIFKGCVKVEYELKIKPELFSMDDRLLNVKQQTDEDYPNGFIWAIDTRF